MSLKDNILHYLLDSKFCLVKFSWESLERILLISCFVQMAHHLDFALSSHKTSNMANHRKPFLHAHALGAAGGNADDHIAPLLHTGQDLQIGRAHV